MQSKDQRLETQIRAPPTVFKFCVLIKHKSHHTSHVSVIKRSLRKWYILLYWIGSFLSAQKIIYEQMDSFLKTNHPNVDTENRKRHEWTYWGGKKIGSFYTLFLGDGYTCTPQMWKLLAFYCT